MEEGSSIKSNNIQADQSSISTHGKIPLEYGTLSAFPTKKRFIGIEFPATVKNLDKALETLGGSKTISKVLRCVVPYCSNQLEKAAASNSKLIELRFRPNDPYCHPVFGDRVTTSNLLLKVKCKRKRSDPSQITNFSTEIVGSIPTTYRFQGLCMPHCLNYVGI